MPQTTIWLQADLHRQAKAAGLNVSRICQDAIRTALKNLEPEGSRYYEFDPDGEPFYPMSEEEEAMLIADAERMIAEEMDDLNA